jgi:site-specific DNA-methyltransferase (adenine-specific)
MNEIIQGDCLEVMKTFPDNHFSCIVTDPPYGLSFMGKGWDYAIPDVHYWKEAFRICKPGSFLVAMGGTRTFHRLTCAIEDAGFEIRDCISWLYGSGFPKSHNKFGLEGYGTALKPAWEPCIVAMKPCDGTFKQNAEKWGQAGINIAASRIGTDLIPNSNDHTSHQKWKEQDGRAPKEVSKGELTYSKGRWPANVILDEEAGAMLDEQSGFSKPKQQREGVKGGSGFGYFDDEKTSTMKGVWPGDNGGGASRFFYCAKASSSERNEGLEGLPEICKPLMGEFKDNPGRETPKSSPTARQNHHPTVKPLKLMEYLIKLVMPPKDGLLLDPFAGSGTTILAAKRLGFDAIGIEKSEEYAEIARSRINAFDNEMENDSQLLLEIV